MCFVWVCLLGMVIWTDFLVFLGKMVGAEVVMEVMIEVVGRL